MTANYIGVVLEMSQDGSIVRWRELWDQAYFDSKYPCVMDQNYTAMAGALPKLLRLARGLVRPRAELKTDRSHVSEFHSELR